MDDTETIKLPISLGIMVAQKLKNEHGIDKWKDGTILSCCFTKEELSKIKSLEVTDCGRGCLEGIEKLPNLRHLSIGDKRSNKYVHPDKRKSINDVDVHCIEKCTNLESLSIVNQSNMTDIDLSGLTKLSDLCINNNMNLVTIGGIDKLSNLSYLTCYGNGALEEFNGLDQAIIQNKDNLNELKLDVLLFPKAIGYKPASGKYKQEATETLEFLANSYVPVKWCESLTNTKTTEINHPQMLTMHNKACRILNETCPRCYGVRDTVLAVERYLAENVTYDYEGKKGRHRVIDIELGGKKEKLAVGPKNGTNGAYNCLMENTCVCEGYTRGEQYLLGLIVLFPVLQVKTLWECLTIRRRTIGPQNITFPKMGIIVSSVLRTITACTVTLVGMPDAIRVVIKLCRIVF